MMWEQKTNEGRWSEYVNTDTGESSIKTHKIKPVKQWCDKKHHDYVIVHMRKRLAECSKCGQELRFIVGKHRIVGDRVYLK